MQSEDSSSFSTDNGPRHHSEIQVSGGGGLHCSFSLGDEDNGRIQDIDTQGPAEVRPA